MVEVLLCNLLQWNEGTSAGISEHDIDVAFLLSNDGVQSIEILQLTDVPLHCGHISSDQFHRRIELGPAPPGNKNVCALCHKPFSRGKPEPTIASRNNRDLSFKLPHDAFSI